MATPPTSNCDDVSQDSSGAFSFNQNTNSSTNISNLKNSTENNTSYANGNSAPYQGKNINFYIVVYHHLLINGLFFVELFNKLMFYHILNFSGSSPFRFSSKRQASPKQPDPSERLVIS